MSDLVKIEMPDEQEGTKSVVREWLRNVGDEVGRDDPIVEIETDKVAVEVAAPADGVLAEITIEVGAEVGPGAVLGLLRVNGQGSDNAKAPAPAAANAAPQGVKERAPGHRLSPSVRRLLTEHDISPDDIRGTGRGGRITYADVVAFIEARRPEAEAPPAAAGTRRVPHDSMRKSIAEHMVRSLATAPHVTAVFEADFGAIIAHRQRHKADFEKAGAPLTFSAYFVRACAEAMAAVPQVNSRWNDDYLEVIEDVNVAVGISLGDKGLIAPVIMRAQNLSLLETAKALHSLTEKARQGRLSPADMRNGTFTISNHGVSGSLLAAPIIINQPQSAILGVGKLEKRVVVREVEGTDAIQIRPMAYVSLSIDHRVLDGHHTNSWLTRFVDILENWPPEEKSQ